MIQLKVGISAKIDLTQWLIQNWLTKIQFKQLFNSLRFNSKRFEDDFIQFSWSPLLVTKKCLSVTKNEYFLKRFVYRFVIIVMMMMMMMMMMKGNLNI